MLRTNIAVMDSSMDRILFVVANNLESLKSEGRNSATFCLF